jgi:hypothetical protein
VVAVSSTLEMLAFLELLEAEPLYPVEESAHVVVDPKTVVEPATYLASLPAAPWDTDPWKAAEVTALQAVLLLERANAGEEELLPLVEQGVEYILSRQNPETGLWGSADLPLDQQIGGALKVVNRFPWRMGFTLPHMDRMADTLIRLHREGELHSSFLHVVVLRNVAELAYACLATSPYRRAELRQLLMELLDEFRRYQQPDGGFSAIPAGNRNIVYEGQVVVPESGYPRSDYRVAYLAEYGIQTALQGVGWAYTGPMPPFDAWRYQRFSEDKWAVRLAPDGDGVDILPYMEAKRRDVEAFDREIERRQWTYLLALQHEPTATEPWGLFYWRCNMSPRPRSPGGSSAPLCRTRPRSRRLPRSGPKRSPVVDLKSSRGITRPP